MSTIINRENVADQVHRYLRSKILRGEYPEGARLVELEIAAELGVSRTPVREALARLQGEDLIRQLKYSGFVVTDIRRELLDILDIRIALETHAVRRAVETITVEELEALEAICKEMEALPFDAVTERAAHNRRFHEILVGAARNRRLVKIVSDYQEYFEPVQKHFGPEAIQRTQREHRAIVAALRKRDVDRSVALVRKHISYSGELIRRQLQETEDIANVDSTIS